MAWRIPNVVNGRIAEELVHELFKELGFEVYPFGYEQTVTGLTYSLKEIKQSIQMLLIISSTNVKNLLGLVLLQKLQVQLVQRPFLTLNQKNLKQVMKLFIWFLDKMPSSSNNKTHGYQK